ncbi:hypothetical protein F7Q99_26775 [Streptomyces kaniharaensis]|uniref:DUF4034 domain-containing protein n=1 Tax=Streptomyces kaniharaensis TaxID=212423 RepID=A0A6N7KVV0_9ACTN|nr:hypothetical protein [Streptomyces kaniharaensis]MQS15772.1 hypothetical protein [Streptomyces kaniharaensis]
MRPELDDVNLGRVRRQLNSSGRLGPDDIQIDQVERLLREAGTDWDRRTHRFAVLADAAAPSAIARSWRMRRSHSADALVFEAWVELCRGRHAGRMEDARAAADNCYRAAELFPADPTPWVVLLGILRVMRADSQNAFAVWHEVVSRDPWNREAHLQMLRYLSPEECGSRSSQLDFVETVRASVPSNAPAVGVGLTALVDEHARTAAQGGVEALLIRRQWTHNRATSALDAALLDWPRQGHLRHAAALADLNLLAFALIQAGRVRESADTFELIGDMVTAWPWSVGGDPIQQFGYWQAKALA